MIVEKLYTNLSANTMAGKLIDQVRTRVITSPDKTIHLTLKDDFRSGRNLFQSPKTDCFFFRTILTGTITLYEVLNMLASKHLVRKRRVAIARKAAKRSALEGRKNLPQFS